MNVLITGATGFIGKALSRALCIRGDRLVVLTRTPPKLKERFPYPCRSFCWTAGEIPPEECFKDIDAIVHLAGDGVADGRWSEAKKKEILESRRMGTANLVEGLRRAVDKGYLKKPIFIGASAIGYYGDRGDEELTEESAAGSGFLADVCKVWESEAFAAQDAGALRVAVMRIGIVLGRDGGALDKMLPAFKSGVGGRLASGRQWMSWIHKDDIVGLLLAALDNNNYVGVVNATAPTPVTNGEFTKALARVVHRPAVIPVPAFAVSAAFGEVSTELLASHKVLPKKAIKLNYQFKYSELSSALGEACGSGGESLYVAGQFIPLPLEKVFSFFSDAKNLEKLTPPWLNFRVVSVTNRAGQPIDTSAIGAGSLIDYKLKVHGLPIKWRTSIERWEPPRLFVDTQLKGPYSLWHHTHEFWEVDGGTYMEDRVRYRIPLGLTGRVAAGWFVDNDVKQIFNYRFSQVEQLLTV